jgi:hypothetical protein
MSEQDGVGYCTFDVATVAQGLGIATWNFATDTH